MDQSSARRRIVLALSILNNSAGREPIAAAEAKMALEGASIDTILALRSGEGGVD
jgi:hypothetical protein